MTANSAGSQSRHALRHTFDQRYIHEVLAQGSLVQWIRFIGAWAMKT